MFFNTCIFALILIVNPKIIKALIFFSFLSYLFCCQNIAQWFGSMALLAVNFRLST
jgi:uncharacterized MnhB-related membrane protein